jgi:serine/threonine protein kinase
LKKLQYDAIHNASPQKLLKDIEELLDSTTNCEKVNEYVNDDSSFSSSSLSFNGSSKEGESTFGFPHLRRSSWDGSRDSVKDDNWGSYHSHKVEPWADADYDDSFSPSGPARKQRFPQNATRKVSQNTKQYKYQISMYIQMQLCHPATLADWIRERNRQIPESDHAVRIGPAMEIFQQICSGLAHVHDNHIVHRDLKPNNVFVSKDGKKILIGDFGLSKELHEIACHDKDDECSSGKRDSHAGTQKHSHQSPTKSAKEILTSHIDRFGQEENALVMAGTKSNALTKDGPPLRNEPLTAGIGTASYAAPEQVKSKHYGTPADIFSLGLILLELVCCFETEHERLHNFQQCRYQKVPRWLEEHYEHVAEIILACTQTDARDRPTATELLDLSKSPTSPKTSLEVQVLKGQLLEKDKQLAEKDRIIEGMRLKMERMKASMSSTIMPPPTDRAVIENVLPSDDDDNESCNT